MLTANFVDAVRPPAAGQKTYWDGKQTGLGLRVSQGGRKSWVLVYRMNGRGNSRWLTLGTNPPLSLKDAREKALAALHGIQKKNEDPATEKQEARRTATFADLADRYLKEHAARKKKPRSIAEDTRLLDKELRPLWGRRPAKDVPRGDVIELLDAVAERGAPITANRLKALISKIYNFGIGKEIVDANPAHNVIPPGDERRRDRVLSPDEIRRVWRASEVEKRIPRALFRLLLLTGQRRSEVREMSWPEIDRDEALWTIPGERTKNRETHVVPLVGEALEIIKALRSEATSDTCKDSSSWVFPGQAAGAYTGLQDLQKRIAERAGVSFHIHDLRRTVGTGLGELNIDRTVIKKILNHSERGDVTARYDRHRYESEKRQALVRWDRRLHEIVVDKADSKVVALPA